MPFCRVVRETTETTIFSMILGPAPSGCISIAKGIDKELRKERERAKRRDYTGRPQSFGDTRLCDINSIDSSVRPT